MTKYSPQIALAAAHRELDAAREYCPHWDYEHDGDMGDCCYRVDDARREVRRLFTVLKRQEEKRRSVV